MRWLPWQARHWAPAAIGRMTPRRSPRSITSAFAEAGPAGAVEVCAVEAQGLTAATGARHGVALGRTSTRLRNPRNAPRPWVKAWLDRQPTSAAAAKAEVIDLGDRLGVVRPIAAAAACLACHGTAIDPETRALLGERYPADAAVGFAEGDLRGAFWVEVPKVAAAPVADDEGGPSDD
jgi:hypothetical protein